MHEDRKNIKTKVSDYFRHLYDHLPSLILSNILFVICSIPIITAGPSLIALNRTACAAVSDRDVRTVNEFFTTWKRDFLSGLILNLTAIPLFVLMLVLSLRSITILFTNGFVFPSVFVFLIYYLLCSFLFFLFPLLAYMDAGWPKILKNTFVLFVSNGVRTFLSGIISGTIILVGTLLFPHSFPFLVLIVFSLAAYNSCYFFWDFAKDHIFKPYYQSHPDEHCEIDLD